MNVIWVCNARTSQPLASAVEFALTRTARRRGLLGRPGLQASAALILSPCRAIHTAFMRFAIDVIFIDGHWRTLRTVHAMAPWRAAAVASAAAVIELPAGTLRACEVSVGDRLFLTSPGTVWQPDERCMSAPDIVDVNPSGEQDHG